jgi:transposase
VEDNSVKYNFRNPISISLYFIGSDISKHKHDCCIISADDQQTVVKVTITNDKDIFKHLFTMLFFNPNDIKIKFESILSKVSENYFQPLLYPFHFHYSIWHKDYN